MRNLGQDLALALRLVRKNMGFSTLVVVCLGLGIGGNSAIFSVVNAVLLRALPYQDPERLIILRDIHQGPAGEPVELDLVSSINFLAWSERARSLERLAAMVTEHKNLTGSALPERVNSASVTASLFPLLGVQPALGRTFLAEEDKPGGRHVAVLSHALWQRRFSSDPGVIGRTVTLNGQNLTVVGVMGRGFRFLEDVDIWVPLAMDPADPPKKQSHFLLAVGRMNRGVGIESVQKEINALSAELAREHPDTNDGWTAKVVPLRDSLVGEQRRALLVLLMAVGLVLLIACANVTNLLIARNLARSDEIAVRAALGAGRERIVRQMLTESVLFAILGGLLGLLLAACAIELASSLAPPEVIEGVSIDMRVLLFTFLISLLAGFAPGIVPALRASSPQLAGLLKGGQRHTEGARGRLLQSAMVIFEVALAVVLLVLAGLMIKSLDNLYRKDPGVRAQGVLTLQVTLPEPKYQEPVRRTAFWRNLLARVRATPGISGASATSVLPVTEFSWTAPFVVEGRLPANPGDAPVAHLRRVFPGFFETLGITILQGRGFEDGDDENGLPVVVVSREMARRYWPGENPIGKRIQRVRSIANNPWLSVVGVAADVQDLALDSEPDVTMYTPFPQNTTAEMNLVVRASGDPLNQIAAIREAILAVDPEQSISEITTLDDWIASSLVQRRFNTVLLILFAALGFVLAAIGLYGVLSYAVSQRRHEIGIRMALGAGSGDVVRMVVHQGMRLALTGLCLGMVVSVALTRVLSGLLFQVTPTDPLVFGSIPLALATVAFAASYLPARRAARVEPILSLK